jgi:hypothetical protein
VLSGVSDEQLSSLQSSWGPPRRVAERVVLSVEGLDRLQLLLAEVIRGGISVVEVSSRQETLEDLFMRHNIGRPEQA